MSFQPLQPLLAATTDAASQAVEPIPSHAVWSDLCRTARLPDYEHYESQRLSDYDGDAALMPSFVDDDDGLVGRLIAEVHEVTPDSIQPMDRSLSSVMYEADTRANTATMATDMGTTARTTATLMDAALAMQTSDVELDRSADEDDDEEEDAGAGGDGMRVVHKGSWFDIVEDDSNVTHALMELQYQRDRRLDRKRASAEQATEDGAAATLAGESGPIGGLSYN